MKHATFKINEPLALQKVIIGLDDLFENDIKGLDMQGDLYEHMPGKLNSAGRHRHRGVGVSFRVSVFQKTGCFYIQEDLLCL